MNKNTHMIVAKRYSEDEGAYRYVPIANRNSLYSARKFVETNKTAFTAGDVILIVHIDGITYPDVNAKFVYGVNSKRQAVEIRKDQYSPDYEIDVCGFYDYYNKLDGDMLVSRSFSKVSIQIITKAVYECFVWSLKEENLLTPKEKDACLKIIKQVASEDENAAKRGYSYILRLQDKYKKQGRTYSLVTAVKHFSQVSLCHNNHNYSAIDAVNYAAGALIELCDAGSDWDLAAENIEDIVKSIITPEVWILAIAEKAK